MSIAWCDKIMDFCDTDGCCFCEIKNNKKGDGMVTNGEVWLMRWMGEIIRMAAVSGIVLSATYDKIFKGVWQGMGWAQAGAILAFGALYVVGLTVQELNKKLLLLVKKEEGN